MRRHKWDTVITEVDNRTLTGEMGLESLGGVWNLLEEMRQEIVGREMLRDPSFGLEGVFNKGKLRPTEEPNVWVAVDACTSTGRGVVWYDGETGRPKKLTKFIPNTVADKMDYAFILETTIILEMLEATDLRPQTGADGVVRRTVVRCVSDCVGAIVCVMKGYSRNNRACAIIRTIHELLEKHDAVLELRWVAGLSMVADQTSRKEELDEDRIKASWEALKMKKLMLPKGKARGDSNDVEFQ